VCSRTISFIACLLVSTILTSRTGEAAAAIRPAHSYQNALHRELTWLPNQKVATVQTYAYLESKIDLDVTLPPHPKDTVALTQWLFSRQNVSQSALVLYPTYYQNLLVAQEQMMMPDQGHKRAGILIAYYTNLWAQQNLKDQKLSVLICEAFLLPNLDVAFLEGGHTVSKDQILEACVEAYRSATEAQREIGFLKFAIHYTNGQETDWARVVLAHLFADQGKYQDAAILLKSIKSHQMSGVKSMIPKLQKQSSNSH